MVDFHKILIISKICSSKYPATSWQIYMGVYL